MAFTASNLTVDFRGARLQGSQVGVYGILLVQSSSNIVLNDPTVYGTGYVWGVSTEWEHGIHIDGGSNITLNHPTTRNTRGDGIFVGYSGRQEFAADRCRDQQPEHRACLAQRHRTGRRPSDDPRRPHRPRRASTASTSSQRCH